MSLSQELYKLTPSPCASWQSNTTETYPGPSTSDPTARYGASTSGLLQVTGNGSLSYFSFGSGNQTWTPIDVSAFSSTNATTTTPATTTAAGASTAPAASTTGAAIGPNAAAPSASVIGAAASSINVHSGYMTAILGMLLLAIVL